MKISTLLAKIAYIVLYPPFLVLIITAGLMITLGEVLAEIILRAADFLGEWSGW